MFAHNSWGDVARPPADDLRGPFAFVRRHWRGHYPLVHAYWINFVGLTLLLGLLGNHALPWMTQFFSARAGSVVALSFSAFVLLALSWSVRGVWVSASAHRGRGGSGAWALVAKLLMVLAVYNWASGLVSSAPGLEEHAQIAMGESIGSPTQVELRVDGRSVLLSGGINDGSSTLLEEVLTRAPKVDTVALNSVGGWIHEGELLAQVIRQRGLNTYVEGYCASACTIAFLAGKTRAAAPSSRLGFHAGRQVGGLGTAQRSIDAPLRRLYDEAGVKPDFIERALATPHHEIWHPSHAEMLAAGVFTRTSEGGETAVFSTQIKTRAALVDAYKKNELFNALAQRAPQDFEAMVDASWHQLQRGATDVQVMGVARQQMIQSLNKYLPLASDDTLVDYFKLLEEQIEALQATDAQMCAQMVFPSDAGYRNPASALPKQLIEREMAITAAALREADGRRSQIPNPAQLQSVVRAALVPLTPLQRSVFLDANLRRRAPELTCSASRKYVGAINALDRAQRVQSIRILLANA